MSNNKKLEVLSVLLVVLGTLAVFPGFVLTFASQGKSGLVPVILMVTGLLLFLAGLLVLKRTTNKSRERTSAG